MLKVNHAQVLHCLLRFRKSSIRFGFRLGRDGIYDSLLKRILGSGQLVSDDATSRFSTSPIWGFLGQADEKSFGAADIAESIRVLVLNHFTDELRAVFAEPGERLVDVVHSEHDAKVSESVHRGVSMIGDYRRGEKSRKLEAAVALGGDPHCVYRPPWGRPGGAPRPLP